MNPSFTDNRGTISRSGAFMRVDNAFVEEVSATNRNTGHIVISYSMPRPNGRTSVELLRLNVERNTIIMNSSGIPICLCDIRRGMWIDARFSPAMTRSIPPQSHAFLITVQRRVQPSASTTTDRVAAVDNRNRFLFTGNPHDINNQIKFVISDSTVITNRNGNRISLRLIQPGQMVRVTHANFQTASIPPQTTAFTVQII